MSFTVLSDDDRTRMLAALGLESTDDLFRDIPASVKKNFISELPDAISEQQIYRLFEDSAKKNRSMLSFTGCGLYRHYIPAAVDHLTRRSEFFTSYTPYQAEVSQGTLTAIFEFQTYICRLTGLEVANASLYDGATAVAEAVLMAARITHRRHVLVSHWLHPHYREVVATYCAAAGLEMDILPGRDGQTTHGDIAALIRDDTAAVVIQTPSCVGTIENLKMLADVTHDHRTLFITAVTEALSLAFLHPMGEDGTDIVCGEAQSFGIPLSFGGPLLGFLATRRDYIRQIPGRICGVTRDLEGNKAFCLTLQTREQHVRRERATSNICTNEGLCMLRSVIYLSILGPKLFDLALHNHGRAGRLKHLLEQRGFKPRFPVPYFNEMLIPVGDAEQVVINMRGKGIDPGFPAGRWYHELSDCIIVSVTEIHSDEDIERFANILAEVNGNGR